eukprot:832381-Prorocentrum_minimum.AAC.6
MAQTALSSAAEGILIDASCGSGLFTRRFVQSGKYDQVVALDFSDSMLQQAIAFCKEQSVPLDNLTFVRADIGRIPFPTNSIDGVHAGAAIHCWPIPEVHNHFPHALKIDLISLKPILWSKRSCGNGPRMINASSAPILHCTAWCKPGFSYGVDC